MNNDIKKLIQYLYKFDNNTRTIKHSGSITFISAKESTNIKTGKDLLLDENYLDFDSIIQKNNSDLIEYFEHNYEIKNNVHKDIIDHIPEFNKMKVELINLGILHIKDKKYYINNFKCEEYLKFSSEVERFFKKHNYKITFLSGGISMLFITHLPQIFNLIKNLF